MTKNIEYPQYPAYKDSGVEWLGEVPEGWSVKSLGSVIQVKSEKGYPDMELLSVYREYGVIPKDSRDDNHNVTSLDTSTYKKVNIGDLVVNKMKAWQGSMGISQYSGIVSPAYITCRITSKDVDSNFFHWLLRSYSFIGEYNRISYGVRVGQWDMHYEDFKRVPILSPPLPEQTRIAALLDRKTAQIDQAIAQKERLIELLKERRQILIQNAVTRGLDPKVRMKDSGVEWIGEVPEGWEVKRIGHLGVVGNGSTPDRSNIRFWSEGTIPWLNSSKVNDGVIDTADQFVTIKALRECHLPILLPGTLVMAITGEGKTRGMTAICQIKATINQHLAYIKADETRIEPVFLLHYLQAMYINIRADSSGDGSTKGAITCSSIKKFSVPIPHQSEQIKIIKYVDEVNFKIDQAIGYKQSEIEKLREYKATLINSAVTGKIKI